MSCTVEDRDRVRKAAQALRDCSATMSVDVIQPAQSQYDRWTLDAVLQVSDGVPPAVSRVVADAGLTLYPVPSQAACQPIVATV